MFSEIRKELEVRGYHDLKINLEYGTTKTASEIKEGLKEALEEFLAGNYTPAQPVGELHLKSGE